MTTATTEGPAATAPSQPTMAFLHACRSEWTKLWTTRSTYWMIAAALVVTIGYTALIAGAIAAAMGSLPSNMQGTLPSAQSLSLSGIGLGQLVIVALGVLVISSEYRTGTIHSSLMAVPQRIRFLLAKVVPFTLVALVVGEIIAFTSFVAAQAFLAPRDMAVGLGDAGMLRAVVGAGLFLAAGGVFGLAVGTLVRNLTGSIAAALVTFLVLPEIVGLLPGRWGTAVNNYFLSNAGEQVMKVGSGGANPVGPWVGYGICWAWIAAIFILGAILLQRRDA